MMSQNSQLKPLLSMEEYSLQRTKRIIKMGLTIQILLLLMCVWLVVLQHSGPSETCLTTNDSSPSASSPIIPMTSTVPLTKCKQSRRDTEPSSKLRKRKESENRRVGKKG